MVGLFDKIQRILEKNTARLYTGVVVGESDRFVDISLDSGSQIRAEALNQVSRNQNVNVVYDGDKNYYCWFQGSDRGLVNKEVTIEIRKRPRPSQEKLNFALLYSKEEEERTECVKPYFVPDSCERTCSFTDFTSFEQCKPPDTGGGTEPEIVPIHGGTNIFVTAGFVQLVDESDRFDRDFGNGAFLNSYLTTGGANSIVNAYNSVLGQFGADPIFPNIESTSFTYTRFSRSIELSGVASVTPASGKSQGLPISNNNDYPFAPGEGTGVSISSYSVPSSGFESFPGSIVTEANPNADPSSPLLVANYYAQQLAENPCFVPFPLDAFITSASGRTAQISIIKEHTFSYSLIGVYEDRTTFELFTRNYSIQVKFAYEVRYSFFQNISNLTPETFIRNCVIPGEPPPDPDPEPEPETTGTKEYYLKLNNREPLLIASFNDGEVLSYYLSTDEKFIYLVFKAGQQSQEEYYKIFFYKLDRRGQLLVSKSATNPEIIDIDDEVSPRLWNLAFIKEYLIELQQQDVSLFNGDFCLLDFVRSNGDPFGNFNINFGNNFFYSLINSEDDTPRDSPQSLTVKSRFNIISQKQVSSESSCQRQQPRKIGKISVNPLFDPSEDLNIYEILGIVFFQS